MEVKQHFTFTYSNCYENPGKLHSKHFWLIRWLQYRHVTKMKSTVNNLSENSSKLSRKTSAPNEAIQN